MSEKILSEILNYAPETGTDLQILLAIADKANDDGEATLTWDWLEVTILMGREELLDHLFRFDVRGQLVWTQHIQSYRPDEPFNIRIPCPITRIAGYVYLIRCGIHYKIGHTTALHQRIPTLSIQLPYRPVVIHTIPTDQPSEFEHELHDRYDHTRLNGEWFSLRPKDIAEICNLAEVFGGAEFYHLT